MNEERIAAYIRSLPKEKDPFLVELRERAREAGVPIIRSETEALLAFFAGLLKPRRILELGTAVGYSGNVLLKSSPGATLVTVENYEPRFREAERNFETAGTRDRATLLFQDAGEYLRNSGDSFDFIFLDAAKAQYKVWLPELKRLLTPGGVLIADNVFQDGNVLESRYAVLRRDRTIHDRMRAFLEEIHRDPVLESVVLSVGDGVSVSFKKGAD